MLRASRDSRLTILRWVCISVALASGCAHVRNNLKNTLADAMDMLRADVSVSLGTDMGAHVMATQFAQLKSYSYEDLYRTGIGTRSIGVWDEEREDWWLGPFHSRNLHMKSKGVGVLSYDLESKIRSGRYYVMGVVAESVDEVGAGFHAFVLGARVGVRPLEILDFLVCPFGLDLCNDSKSLAQRQAEERLRARAEAAAERTRRANDPEPEGTAEDGEPSA